MGDDRGWDGIERWVADARAADAVDARVRERWLRTQAAESSTLVGTLVGLAEAAAPVVVTTTTGRRNIGVVTMVGEDFLAVRRGEERVTLIAFAAIASVEPSAAARPVALDGQPSAASAPVTLIDVLTRAVGDRPRVILYADDARLIGELLAVGADVVIMRTEAGGLAYVAVASVSEASLLDSG